MNIAEIYARKINEEATVTTSIELPSGQLVFGTYSIKDGKVANKKVAAGKYSVNAFWVEEQDLDSLNASVGLNMVVIHFSDHAIVQWVEVKDADGNELIEGDCLEFLLYDQSNIESLENLKDEIASLKEMCYADGMDQLGEGTAVNVYIGEDTIANKVYWGLDAEGNPVKLVGYFDYGFGGDDE